MQPPPACHDPCRVLVQEVQVHSYEVDFKQAASLESVCRFFLDAAWAHAEALGVGFAALAAEQRLWVLSRLLVNIREYPRWTEVAVVRTWPREAHGPFALREFELLNPGGEVLGNGTSSWLILDAVTRKPQRADKILSIPIATNGRAAGRDAEKIKEESAPVEVGCVEARYSDIDVNRHVNSCRYVGLLLDCYSFEFHEEHQVEQLEVNYVGETHAGDHITITRAQTGALEYWHSIRKPTGEVCRARLRWRSSR